MSAVITQSAPILPRLVFLDSNGDPLAGGMVETFATGTTTPAPTYVDPLGVTANTNPIVLDAFGSCNCWLAPGQVYDFQVSDANSALQYTITAINGLPAVLGNAAQSNIGTTTGQTPPDVPSIDDTEALYMYQGLYTISVPSAALYPCNAYGAGANQNYGGQYDTFLASSFVNGYLNIASFVVFMPESWDPTQTIGVQFIWSTNSTDTGNVVWQLDAAAASNGSPSPSATGATIAATPSAATGEALDVIVTPVVQLPVITGATKGCQLNFQVSRQGANISDTLATTALLRGVKLTYHVNAGDDTP